MSSILTIEERVGRLEMKLARLDQQIAQLRSLLDDRPMTIPGIGKIGCLKDFPDPEGLAEAMKQAREELNQIIVADPDDH